MSDGVTAVIPVWNRGDLLRELLDSIAAQTTPFDQVIAVDNGSTDDAPQIARDRGARVISMDRNAGFAAAVNRGIVDCRTSYIALLNSDVKLDPNWLAALLRSMRETDAWMASGQIRMATDPTRLDGTWDLIARSGCSWRAGCGQEPHGAYLEKRVTALLPATAALYRRELFDRVGLFAEIYDSYLEDVDFCLRCAAAGFMGVYAPEALCTHQGSASIGQWSARATKLIARNQLLLVRRLFPRKWIRQVLVGQILWGAVAARHGQLPAWLGGKVEALRMWRSISPLSIDTLAIEDMVMQSEREIRSLSVDTYWRLYFRTTGGEFK